MRLVNNLYPFYVAPKRIKVTDVILLSVFPSTVFVPELDLPVNCIKSLDVSVTSARYSDKVYPVKDVFKTFKEINQMDLVKQAGVRQQYIDQSVSLNLAFPSIATPKWINQVTMEAWKQGIKTLYYMRTESVLRGDIAERAVDPDCVACDG